MSCKSSNFPIKNEQTNYTTNVPHYPLRMVDRLTKHSEQVAEFPRSGRMVPEFQSEDIREVIERPYRIIYRIKPEQTDALAVIHGARQIEPHMIN